MIQTDWADKAYLRTSCAECRACDILLRWASAALFVILWLGLFNIGAGIES